jgi:GMP synthase (glutamine-hydrolysing)
MPDLSLMTKRSVLVMQNAAPETTGSIGHTLTLNEITERTVHPYSGEKVPLELDDAVGLVIMGGPIGIYDQARHSFIRDELKLIEHALRSKRPVLGVCLGSQLLAAALGAEVKKAFQKELGWHPVWLSEEASHDSIWTGVPRQFTAFHWHGDVFSLPTGTVSLAQSELTACQAFRYDSNAYGLLFHLEVTESLLRAMVGAFSPELAEASLEGSRIVEAIPEHLPGLRKISSRVFEQWGTLLSAQAV